MRPPAWIRPSKSNHLPGKPFSFMYLTGWCLTAVPDQCCPSPADWAPAELCWKNRTRHSGSLAEGRFCLTLPGSSHRSWCDWWKQQQAWGVELPPAVLLVLVASGGTLSMLPLLSPTLTQ